EGTGIIVRTNASVRMREKPNKEADALRTLSSGTKVEVLLRGEGWTMVKYKDQTGYVMSRYLNFP
ncbi:MAG: SH3 domain-containing protein, partial [Clostridia bacterium]|nr:SH3 domain-containing protein [Clostridia bacterium]